MEILTKVVMDGNDSTLTAEKLTEMIGIPKIKVAGFYNHTKASEKYVQLEKFNCNGVCRTWVVPYVYRRTNTFIETALQLAEYIRIRSKCLESPAIASFKCDIERKITTYFGGAPVTIPIFKALLDNVGNWVWNRDFNNPNPQRRIQDIKEKGFTLVTKIEAHKTFHMLLPFYPVPAPTYETISPKVRKRIFEVLEYLDAFTAKRCALSALPDHKFPEIRWDEDTATSNSSLTDDEIKEKFQIVPEYINQTKREVCRKCFQEGLRGLFAGIEFYYSGSDRWDEQIPMKGKAAERGCVGCFWYDMNAWRKALNEKLIGTCKE